jgi:hypothetical protein
MTEGMTIAIALASPAITCTAAVALARRAERMSREKERTQQVEQMKGLLQTMVVDRIEVAFGEISKLQRRMGDTEGRHTYLLGLLVGKGCVDAKACDRREEP